MTENSQKHPLLDRRKEKSLLRVKDRERMREIIDGETLIRRLQDFATAKVTVDGETGIRMIEEDKLMTSEQLQAATTLLRKKLPDLASVEQSVDPEQFAISPEPITPEAWAAEHGQGQGRPN